MKYNNLSVIVFLWSLTLFFQPLYTMETGEKNTSQPISIQHKRIQELKAAALIEEAEKARTTHKKKTSQESPRNEFAGRPFCD